jgi:ribose transport system permease protein
MLVALLVALALGLFNGVLVSGFQINPFVATLSTGMMIRGLAVVITGGFLVTVKDRGYTLIGRQSLLGVKYSVWIFAAVVAITWFVLARTTLGRHVYAVGGNAEAARLSGIRVGWVKTLTFAISGAAAGLAGLIASSRVSTGQADAGSLIELTAIAAVVIGGTSIAGGEGTIWRTVIGVLLLALIGNGFNMLSVEPFYQDIVKGAIIVVSVAVDAWSKRRT